MSSRHLVHNVSVVNPYQAVANVNQFLIPSIVLFIFLMFQKLATSIFFQSFAEYVYSFHVGQENLSLQGIPSMCPYSSFYIALNVLDSHAV